MWAEVVPPAAVSVYLFGMVAVTRACNRTSRELELNVIVGIFWPVFLAGAGLVLGWRLIMDDSASPSRKPARVTQWPHQRYTPGGVIITPAGSRPPMPSLPPTARETASYEAPVDYDG